MTSRVFVELDGNMRRRIEALIELLIDLCDQLDGDGDIEVNGDELESDADSELFMPLHLRGGGGDGM